MFGLLSFSTWAKDNFILLCCLIGAIAVAILLVIALFVIRYIMRSKHKSQSVESVLTKSGATIEVTPEDQTPVELSWNLQPTPAKTVTAKKTVKEEKLAEESVAVAEPVKKEASVVEEPAVGEASVEEAVTPVEEEPPVKPVSQPTFNFITVRYDRSFEARVIQLDGVSKDFYSQLKNELLSYPKVKSRMSWRHEAFRLGRQTVAKMRCRGRRLCLYLALDPKQYAETKYLVEDVSEVKTSAATPCLYRIKNERRCRYAKQLIAAMFAAMGIEKGEEKNDNYVVPYEPLQPLLERGLVKRIEVKSNVLGEAAPATIDEEDDDIVEVVRVPDEGPVEEVVEEVVEEPVEEEHVSVSVVEAQQAMEDEAAVTYVAESSELSDKSKQVVVNVDTLSKYFRSGDRVTIKEMKEVIPFVPNKATYVKVLARGRIDKSLEVVADDFSLDAVKMIVLAGGSVIRKRNN